MLEEGGPDVRDSEALPTRDAAFILGDHLGFDERTRERIAAVGARPMGVGPRSLHAEDVITIVLNELDRRQA